jgi:hypothetical protein
MEKARGFALMWQDASKQMIMSIPSLTALTFARACTDFRRVTSSPLFSLARPRQVLYPPSCINCPRSAGIVAIFKSAVAN